MRTYFFKGIPYIGSGNLSLSRIPDSNYVRLDCEFFSSEFVDFFRLDSSSFLNATVTAISLKMALSLLSHALCLNDLDFLLDSSYRCVTEQGKSSNRLLRSV